MMRMWAEDHGGIWSEKKLIKSKNVPAIQYLKEINKNADKLNSYGCLKC